MHVFALGHLYSRDGTGWKKRSRAKRRRRGRGDLVAPEIPWDLQIEILTRLPAKSLMRFKIVSQRWSCLIRCRYFTNLCLTVASPLRPPRLYMSLLEQVHTYCHSNSMEACHKPGKSLLLSLSSSSSSSSSLDPDLTTMQGIGGDDMVVLRGLILFNVCRKAFIYNPATRQSVTLPAVKSDIFARQESHRKRVLYFLGHDPVLDQYKVLCTVVTYSDESSSEDLTSEHWVFVLEAGGSWKKVECDQPNLPTRRGLCIDGVIYYLASTRTARDVVFSFDVRSEEFNMIQAPLLGESVGYIEYGGKPTIFDYTYLPQNGLVEVWVLEDGGKWCKKSQFLQPSQMHLVEDNNIQELFVECTTQSGEILLVPIPIPTPSYFLYYDLQKNNLRKVYVNGIWGHQGFDMNYCCQLMYMNKSENIMHLET